MKKKAAGLLITAGLMALTAAPLTAQAEGWITDQSGLRYEKTDGQSARNEWQLIDNLWYYFDENGFIKTGWTAVNGAQYYLEPVGAMNGAVWLPRGAMWSAAWTPDGRYVDASGAWIESAGSDAGGAGTVQKPQADLSPSTDTSITSNNGWVQEGDLWKYRTSKGFLTDTWRKIDGKRYYFGSDGIMVTGFQDIEGDSYYFKESGVQQTKTFELDGVYYVIEDGSIIEEVDEFDWSEYKKENKIKSVDKTIGDLKKYSTLSSGKETNGLFGGGAESSDADESFYLPEGQNRERALEALDLLNEKREKKGLAALSTNEKLMDAAEERAEEIVKRFSHQRPDESSAVTILKENDLSYSHWGENIAYGFSTPESVTASWMNSAGHKKNILNSAFEETGLACYWENGTAYWVQIFYTE